MPIKDVADGEGGRPLLLRRDDDIATRPLTRRCDASPTHIDAAIAAGAYRALDLALNMDPGEIVGRVQDSGLRGRGGAGYPTGMKWRLAAECKATARYVVCNADESEPGTFKDRFLMEQDPHALIEGMAICGRAIGATSGVIYLRGEYDRAFATMQRAVGEARQRGLLGCDTHDRDFEFDIVIHRGAGAYICGEETALLESLEGKRGEPRQRPPFPATSGLWGKPTVVNNVETLCSVPSILLSSGPPRTDASRTKLFCLSGQIAKSGICEAPEGITTREVIHDYGGGMKDSAEFKFALTGGAAGTFVPRELLDVPLTYEAFESGVAVGSGAIVVADQSVSAAEMLLWILNFFAHESCGKCTPCRVGTVEARDIVQQIVDRSSTRGAHSRGRVERLLKLAKTLGTMSFCGLGLSVAWPIESAVTHFPEDFE